MTCEIKYDLTQEVDVEVECWVDEAHEEPRHAEGDDLGAEGEDDTPDGQDGVGDDEAVEF